MYSSIKACILTLMLFGLSACSLAPEYIRPEMDMPDKWATNNQEIQPLKLDWWTRFNDPTLTRFIEEALENNRDLAIALARLDQARAHFGLARAEQLPLIGGQASGTQVWSDSTRLPSVNDPWQAGFSAAWEIDLWGKYRNASTAAKAQMLAMQANQDAVWLSVAGQTANGYFLLRSLDSQLATATRTLGTRTDALIIYEARYEQGIIGELDLMQAKTTVETARTALYQTQLAKGQAETALAVLLGRSPKEIMYATIQRGTALEALPVDIVIPSGLPVDLLVRRPDIRIAEEQLKAANANIGVARAAYLPSLSLTGLLGAASPELYSLIQNPTETSTLGGSVFMPLLDFGRVSSNVDAAKAAEREAFAMYESTTQNAFREMHNALIGQTFTMKIVDSLKRMVNELKRSTELARTRYDNGYASYLEVLDAERSLFQTELDLATAKKERLIALVNVCLALGGGWEDDPNEDLHEEPESPKENPEDNPTAIE